MCCIVVLVDQIRLITKTDFLHVVCCDFVELVLAQLFTYIKVQGDVNAVGFSACILFNQLLKPCELVEEPQLLRLSNKVGCTNALGNTFLYFLLIVV